MSSLSDEEIDPDSNMFAPAVKPLSIHDNRAYRRRFKRTEDVVKQINNLKWKEGDKVKVVFSSGAYEEMDEKEFLRHPFGRMTLLAMKQGLMDDGRESEREQPSRKEAGGNSSEESDGDRSRKSSRRRKKRSSSSDWYQAEGRELLKRRKKSKKARSEKVNRRMEGREEREDDEDEIQILENEAPPKSRINPNNKKAITLKRSWTKQHKSIGKDEEGEARLIKSRKRRAMKMIDESARDSTGYEEEDEMDKAETSRAWNDRMMRKDDKKRSVKKKKKITVYEEEAEMDQPETSRAWEERRKKKDDKKRIMMKMKKIDSKNDGGGKRNGVVVTQEKKSLMKERREEVKKKKDESRAVRGERADESSDYGEYDGRRLRRDYPSMEARSRSRSPSIECWTNSREWNAERRRDETLEIEDSDKGDESRTVSGERVDESIDYGEYDGRRLRRDYPSV
ncbi:hypothetical protein PMAYCL1PPCAC_20802, partial [Pristionchus mayeri]